MLLAGGFLASYFIAKALGEDSAALPYHAMIGLTLCLMVLLRLVWGVLGTKWARLTALRLSPLELRSYFQGVLATKGKKYVGHNPATTVTMLLIFALVLALGPQLPLPNHLRAKAWPSTVEPTVRTKCERIHPILG